MQESIYSVTQAVKLLDVQPHVLRYWEEEMKLPIGRNKMGHRYYTRWDIQVFLSIKELKKKGYALKEIGELTAFFYEGQAGNKTEACKRKEKKLPKEKQESEKAREKEKKTLSPEFMEILSKLVAKRLQEADAEELRFKKLDERIRNRQQTRREAAASLEKKNVKKKGVFHRAEERKG